MGPILSLFISVSTPNQFLSPHQSTLQSAMKLPKPISRLFSSSSTTLQTPQTPNKIPHSIHQLHAHLIRTELHRDPFSISDILRSYALNPHYLNKTKFVFNQIHQPRTSNWNSMIRALSESDHPIEAIYSYNKMRCRSAVALNDLTFIFILKACARLQDFKHSRNIHLHCMKLGFLSYIFVSNALIHTYGSCGELGLAQRVFDEMPERDLVSWNSLICGFSQTNKFRDVLRIFEAMQVENVKADAVTMVKTVLACSRLGDQEFADYLVKYIERNNVEMDVYLGNTLIDLYGRRGSVESARSVFDRMFQRNVVSWNTMIMAYMKTGKVHTARNLFDKMPMRDVISWTSMITGYCQNNGFTDAVKLFREMMIADVKPDQITVATVLSACAHQGLLEIGEEIHDYIRKHDIKADIHVGNSLINMYCKCGCIRKALEVFREMDEKDTVSWSSVIMGLAVNGEANNAVKFFSHMLSQGIQPTDVSFIGVLLGCSHAGLVVEGLEYFESMTKVYQVQPTMKHYGCVVDLLSRSGNLEKAYEFIKNIPLPHDAILWRILLSACKLHENVEMAELALKKLLEFDAINSGNYVLLSNTYSNANRWDAAADIRMLMKESDVEKAPGCSSIEVSG